MNPFDRALVWLYRRARANEDALRYERYRRIHDIDPTFRFNGPGIILSEDGRIRLGAHSYLGMHSMLLSKRETSIEIGECTAISHHFIVYTKNVLPDQDRRLPKEEWKYRTGSVRIGNHCWIGFRVFVVEGVTIGDNVVVGAHSVVTKDLEANGIYGGVPARLIARKPPLDGLSITT